MKVFENLHQKLVAFFVAEVVILNFSRRALKVNKVRCVGTNEIYLRLTEQPFVCIAVGRVAADNGVPAKVPDIKSCVAASTMGPGVKMATAKL